MALGESFTFTVSPNSGYAVDTIILDGSSYINTGSSNPPEGSTWTSITISNVSSSSSLSISFAVSSDDSGVPDKYKHTVIAIAGEGGSVDPESQLVVDGEDAEISIDPDDSEAEKIGLNKVNQEYLNDFDVFKNIFAQIPNINYENLEILKKSISSFREQRKIDDMVKFFIENNISIDDLYYNSRRLNSTETLEPDVVYSYLKRDFTKTFTSQSFTNNKGTAINPEEVKSIFLSNLDKNIQVINEIFEYFEEEDFTEEEKKKI